MGFPCPHDTTKSEKSHYIIRFSIRSLHPVFATEIGYEDDTDYKNIVIGNTPYRQAIIDYFETQHISWTVWGFSASWATTLLKDNQTYEPNDAGAYFKSRLLELNFPGVPTPALPTPKPTVTG